MAINKGLKKATAVLFALALVFCSSCKSEGENVSEVAVSSTANYSFSQINTRGNTNGNIANYGLGVAQGDTVFFSNPCDEYYIYTVENGKPKKVFEEMQDAFLQMNLIGDNIYYISGVYGDMCYYNVNGGIPGGFADINTYVFLMDGDALYAVDCNDGYVKRWKMNSESIEGEQLGTHKAYVGTGDKALAISVDGEYIYYAAADDSYKVYRVSLKDNTETKVIDSGVSFMIAEGDKIYYANEDGNKLYSCDGAGENAKVLSEKKVAALNVNEKYIFYSVADEGLFRIDLSGENEIKLSDLKNISYINLMNEYAFIYSGVEGEVLSATSKLIKESGEEIGSWEAQSSQAGS